MTELLTYELKVAVLVAVFYLFYRLLLSRETYHRANRMVLLLTAVASFVLPLCVLTFHQTVTVEAPVTMAEAGAPLSLPEEEQDAFPWATVCGIVLIIGAVVTWGYRLMGVAKVCKVIARSERHPQADGTVVCVTDSDLSPFSWLHYIVLSRSDYEASNAAVLAHERGHIRLHHTLDVLLVDTLTALQWFNPAMWMLRQDLRTIHEYEADQAVLSQGINMRQYQYLLIQKAVASCGYSAANGISHSTLKNRINMMLHKKSNRARRLKLLALVPIVGAVIGLQAHTVTDYVYQQPQKKLVKKGNKSGQVKVSGVTLAVKTDTTAVVKGKESAESSAGEPLCILNGQKVSSHAFDAIDPKYIEHVEVLKEKSAVDLYGEEGRHGAVVITTKSNVHVKVAEKVDVSVVKSGEAVDYAKVFDVVEQMPEFPGGPAEMMKFVSMNVRYPEAAHEVGAQGRVVVQFIVETNGTLSNVKVIQKANDDLDAEAVRLIGSMPKWKPGMQNGKAVRVKYALPVTFKLN